MGFELEDGVGWVLRKVDPERRVERLRVDGEGAVRLVLVCGDQGEFGGNRAAALSRRAGKKVIRTASYA